jgi:hypothetical protein
MFRPRLFLVGDKTKNERRNMSENNEIQKIVLEAGEPILCPICNHCVLDEKSEEPSLSTCSHTIFIATDEGIEYKTSLFENNLKDLGINIEPDAMFESDESWDSVTDKLTINGYIKVTYSNPSPSYAGIYYGFAPGEHSEKEE